MTGDFLTAIASFVRVLIQLVYLYDFINGGVGIRFRYPKSRKIHDLQITCVHILIVFVNSPQNRNSSSALWKWKFGIRIQELSQVKYSSVVSEPERNRKVTIT